MELILGMFDPMVAFVEPLDQLDLPVLLVLLVLLDGLDPPV
jgi:hypothetical protein